jgi:hypothetical protein
MSGGLGGGEGLGWGAGSRGTTILFAGGSTRPQPVTDGPELTAAKRTLAPGRLQAFSQFETLIARPR